MPHALGTLRYRRPAHTSGRYIYPTSRATSHLISESVGSAPEVTAGDPGKAEAEAEAECGCLSIQDFKLGLIGAPMAFRR